jgi:ribonuclease P protein component
MVVAGSFRAVRRTDRAFSGGRPKPLSPKGGLLDIMVFRRETRGLPLLLVGAPRRTGGAVERNRFRRRVRMAFLAALRKWGAQPFGDLIVWVRPDKGSPSGCRLRYQDIEKQIESSLCRLVHP